MAKNGHKLTYSLYIRGNTVFVPTLGDRLGSVSRCSRTGTSAWWSLGAVYSLTAYSAHHSVADQSPAVLPVTGIVDDGKASHIPDVPAAPSGLRPGI